MPQQVVPQSPPQWGAGADARVRGAIADIRAQGAGFEPVASDFDRAFFGAALPGRRMDPRIQQVIDSIKRQPSGMAATEDCAQQAQLSSSRFLHLFREEVGAPFRGFHTWKRARSQLHYVNRDANRCTWRWTPAIRTARTSAIRYARSTA